MDDLSVKGKIHSIETFGAVDGPGIRFIVFFQGCHLKCLYCHNPDSWDISQGTQVSVAELIKQIKSYKSFLSGGVTLSGGEPLLQPEFALALLNQCHKEGFHTALDTAGAVPLDISKPVIDMSDMLLLDIKGANQFTAEKLSGRDYVYNNAFKTLQYCDTINKPVWIRHVIVPGITLNYEHLEELAVHLKQFNCIERIELLPFHKLGEHKWDCMDTPYTLYDTPIPASAEMHRAVDIFIKHGLNAR